MLASIFIPTRKRPQELMKTLDSISKTTSNVDDIEVFIKSDIDDELTYKFFLENRLDVKYKVYISVESRPHMGWLGVYEDYNKMAARSIGEFLIPFNDDADFATNGWDDILREYSGKVCVLHPKNPSPWNDVDMMFPIIHRTIVQVTGCFALSTSIDRQYEMMAELFPEIRIKEFRINFNHPRTLEGRNEYFKGDMNDIRNHPFDPNIVRQKLPEIQQHVAQLKQYFWD